MREGLRSRTLLQKDSGARGVVESGGVEKKSFDFNVEGSSLPQQEEGMDLTTEKKEEVECAVKKECGFDLNESPSVNADLANDVIDKGCSSGRGGGSVREADAESEVSKNEASGKGCCSGAGSSDKEAVETYKNKKGVSNDSVLISGRVLRSRSKRGDDTKSFNGESSNALTGKSNKSGGLERVEVKKEHVEADEFVSDCQENERVRLKQKGCESNLKRKRGRPPKIEPREEDQFVVQLPRKRGRPPIIRSNEQGQSGDQLIRKRGRPPKAVLQNKLPEMTHNRKGKMGFQNGKKCLIARDSATVNAVPDTHSLRASEKDLENNRFSAVKNNKFVKVLKTENNGVALPVSSNTVKPPVGDKSVSNKDRQVVREQIMERLSAAGWTVDYRKRNGRQYRDAVYVSLDGKTHWSITLAYNRLKNHYEAGDGEGKVYGPGFKFTPIPEEDYKILTKVISKERNDKNKPRPKGGKSGKTVDGVNRKVKKEKQGSGAGKGKFKRKQSLHEADNATSRRMSVMVRDHKRHKMQNKKRCAPLVRNAEEEIDSETDGYVPYNGKRTVFAWMIDLGTVVENQKIHYMHNRREFAPVEGRITGDGIRCGCCNEIVTISDFEAHAGSKLSESLKNIYTEGGTSLLQCLLDSWNKQDEFERKGFHFVDTVGEDPNDDTCGVCGDGGDLICCDGCPSTFHQSCLDIKKFPSGDWHCIYCCCKFCGLAGGSSNERDSDDDFTVSTLLTCHSCQEKYHRSCIDLNDSNTDDSGDPIFCGNKCDQLSENLKVLLGVKHEIEDGFSWSFIRRSDVGFDTSEIKHEMVECNSKLAVTLTVMDECFMPYIDHRSGTNLIHSILYNCGSNFKRLNYSGFVTAILERGDEVISAATIRIHGNKLAEMPFIGTRYMYRRQGMCRRLLNAIECALSSLNVDLLVIPAISELRETWTSVFGFEPLDLTSKNLINNMNLVVFPHVDMLQKKIPKHKVAGENLIPIEVSNLQKSHTIHKVANSCDGAGSSGSDLISSAGIPPSIACQINESCSQPPMGSLNDAPVITSNTIHHDKSSDVTCEVVCQAVDENVAVEAANACNCAISYHNQTSIDLDSQLNKCEVVCQAVDENVAVEAANACNCAISDHDQKSTDLDSQLNKCCVTNEEKQCLGVSHISTEAAEGHELKNKTDFVQPYFKGSEVHAEAVNGCASHCRPNTDSDCAAGEAVLTTIVKNNIIEDLPVANCEKGSSMVTTVPNGNEAERFSAKAPNPGVCESIVASSGFRKKTADGVDERSEAPSVVEVNLLPADKGIFPDTKPEIAGSSELAEPDLQLGQNARSNPPSSCTPNTASGVGPHWASAGSTSCGSTEAIVLSNQAG
ncbi:hypothetical protein Lal_00047105 [Lupinus albus]|uniref:Putative histone acetyltransferase chromatin regulator PHD family n=1 Tax=Lupinus albus TaxID=3870 RepID=A0A6A5MXV8_LUPAL|nr:putative histone acetyltransferase chromatin regulator PHD family [Lupinus albus]KAF1878437.1 hypothetical protein Lal_00047105 [Lupinus albus]